MDRGICGLVRTSADLHGSNLVRKNGPQGRVHPPIFTCPLTCVLNLDNKFSIESSNSSNCGLNDDSLHVKISPQCSLQLVRSESTLWVELVRSWSAKTAHHVIELDGFAPSRLAAPTCESPHPRGGLRSPGRSST